MQNTLIHILGSESVLKFQITESCHTETVNLKLI